MAKGAGKMFKIIEAMRNEAAGKATKGNTRSLLCICLTIGWYYV